MLAWINFHNNKITAMRKILYQFRLLRAYYQYFDHIKFQRKRFKVGLVEKRGDQSYISNLRNKHKEKEIVVIANGPSLSSVDPRIFDNRIVLGCNGVFKHDLVQSRKVFLDYLFFEDVEQFEIRVKDPDLYQLLNTEKFAALYNAYALKSTRGWRFFNAPRRKSDGYYWDNEDIYPLFSEDFGSVVHLGSTIIYVMLQFAFHLGSKTVYIVGLDHNYGLLSKLFEPGKLIVTDKNLELVQSCHFDKDYYKVGDVIGVPYVTQQELAFAKAQEVFRNYGRTLLNATPNTRLEVLDKIKIEEIVTHK